MFTLRYISLCRELLLSVDLGWFYAHICINPKIELKTERYD